ncbi:uridine kinase [Monosporozyma unispora]|nr:Uridine kinase [Kazachstania unispora]
MTEIPSDLQRSTNKTGIVNKHLESRYTPPWTTPYIIGIGGPSGSGKSSVASKIVASINVPWTVLISMDNFYNPLNEEERQRAFNNEFDFDEPQAIDLDLVYETISNLKKGKKCQIPVYSFVHHNRVPNKHVTIYGASVIIIEGIYTLYDPKLLDLMDLKIYVDADLDICLARRLSRDIVSRGRDLNGCIDQWERFVKPNAVKHVIPTMQNADAIIPSMSDNGIAIKLLVDHINAKLEKKSLEHVKELIQLGNVHDIQSLENHPYIHILPKTNQVKAIITMLLDKNTGLDDYIFYFDRIATLLLSIALDDICIESHDPITTSLNITIPNPAHINFDNITAINMIRSGDIFIHSLKMTLPNVSIGKLLIQSDSMTGEPQLHCKFLPPHLEQFKKILLLEAQIINGASMIMAIQVLLEYGAKLENINVVVYSATETGLRRVLNAFNDEVKICVAMLIPEKELRLGHNLWCLTRFIDSKYFGSK